jgi:hypothetical protein
MRAKYDRFAVIIVELMSTLYETVNTYNFKIAYRQLWLFRFPRYASRTVT